MEELKKFWVFSRIDDYYDLFSVLVLHKVLILSNDI